MNRADLIQNSKRVVVKLGTAVLMQDEGGIALSRFYSFIEGLARLRKNGKEVLLVTSGAVGLGAQRLGFSGKPKLLPEKQACASVGQGRLMALYADAFDRLGITCGQLLLTEEDFSNRRRYLNLRSTCSEMIEHGAIPVINENDPVSTAEIEPLKTGSEFKVNFGDNDKLSALVASKMEANLLLILTDVEGLYTGDPRSQSEASLISVVERITPEIEALAEGKVTDKAKLGRGGMRTKLEAAKVATQSGCATIIAGGKIPSVLDRIFALEELGTVFYPQPVLSGKQKWIAFATTVKASILVNSGAREALQKRKASLLPAGVIGIKGSFERGDVVSIKGEDGVEFARGIVNYSSDETQKVTGQHSTAIDELIESRNYDAVVTRDNIAFLVPTEV